MSGESRRGRSIVSATFVGIVSVFIVITTVQLARGVFGKRETKASAGTVPAACLEGIARLKPALDRALGVASQTPDENAVIAAYAAATLPEWNDSSKVEAACSTTPDGLEAFAAILRLRRAEEGLLRRQVSELSPMRQDVEAYLR